jgi:hypothetical protein
MRTIIAGSRDITDFELVFDAVEASGFKITEVVSGGARGVDRLGEYYAELHDIPCKVFKADWDTYGKAAGSIRNGEMGKYAQALIAVWDGVSRGTKHMIDTALMLGLRVYIHRI